MYLSIKNTIQLPIPVETSYYNKERNHFFEEELKKKQTFTFSIDTPKSTKGTSYIDTIEYDFESENFILKIMDKLTEKRTEHDTCIYIALPSKYIDDVSKFLTGKNLDPLTFEKLYKAKDMHIVGWSGSLMLYNYLSDADSFWESLANILGKNADGSDSLVLIDEKVSLMLASYQDWKYLTKEVKEKENKNKENKINPSINKEITNGKIMQKIGLHRSVSENFSSIEEKQTQKRRFSI